MFKMALGMCVCLFIIVKYNKARKLGSGGKKVKYQTHKAPMEKHKKAIQQY